MELEERLEEIKKILIEKLNPQWNEKGLSIVSRALFITADNNFKGRNGMERIKEIVKDYGDKWQEVGEEIARLYENENKSIDNPQNYRCF